MKKKNQPKKNISGKAVFKLDADKKLINAKHIKEILKKNVWQICELSYVQNNWKQVFQLMVQCSAQKLRIGFNKSPNVLKQIKHIMFVNLKELTLYGNNIDNIQAVNFLDCQQLQQLILCCNNIRRINSLNKLSMPFLGIFYIYQNQLPQMTSLLRSNVNQQKFKDLFLQFAQDQFTEIQDLSSIVKFSSEFVQRLTARSQTRIWQPKVQKMLKLRFSQIEIYTIDIDDAENA